MIAARLLTLMLASTGFSTALVADEIVAVAAERVFVPTGFDDNDDVEVVVDGVFPDTCYHIVPGTFEVDVATGSVTLFPKARRSDALCLMLPVPYTYVFNLGKMPMGRFRVKTWDGAITRELPVAEAASGGPDNELYAAIDNATIERHPDGTMRVVLEGMYTNTCMGWDRTEVINANAEVFEILPIVKIADRADCRNEKFPFKGVSVILPNVPPGRFLAHVRAMHGGSVNRVFTAELPTRR